jgi:hypothetical protein
MANSLEPEVQRARQAAQQREAEIANLLKTFESQLQQNAYVAAAQSVDQINRLGAAGQAAGGQARQRLVQHQQLDQERQAFDQEMAQFIANGQLEAAQKRLASFNKSDDRSRALLATWQQRLAQAEQDRCAACDRLEAEALAALAAGEIGKAEQALAQLSGMGRQGDQAARRLRRQVKRSRSTSAPIPRRVLLWGGGLLVVLSLLIGVFAAWGMGAWDSGTLSTPTGINTAAGFSPTPIISAVLVTAIQPTLPTADPTLTSIPSFTISKTPVPTKHPGNTASPSPSMTVSPTAAPIKTTPTSVTTSPTPTNRPLPTALPAPTNEPREPDPGGGGGDAPN